MSFFNWSIMKLSKILAAAAGLVVLTGAAQATLVIQGNGTVLDTNTNLIWLQDWNTTGKPNAQDGQQTWAFHKTWAEGLDFAGSVDWRLPAIGEFTALFSAYSDLTKVTAFTNVQTLTYWSGTEGTGFLSTTAEIFDTKAGNAQRVLKSGTSYAVAVRTGSVPEPQTLALALLALGATVVVRTRQPR